MFFRHRIKKKTPITGLTLTKWGLGGFSQTTYRRDTSAGCPAFNGSVLKMGYMPGELMQSCCCQSRIRFARIG